MVCDGATSKQPHILKSVVVNGKTDLNIEKAIIRRYLMAYLIPAFTAIYIFRENYIAQRRRYDNISAL